MLLNIMQKEGMSPILPRLVRSSDSADSLRAVAAERLRDYWHC